MKYNHYKKSRLYSHKAVVDYYYFKDIKMKQVRKYRYAPSMGQWQRYSGINVYHY